MNHTLLSVAAEWERSSSLLVDSALKGGAILLLAALAAMVLRRDSAATRHLVWLAAIVALLAVPLFSAILPQWRVLPAWAVISPKPMAREAVAPAVSAPEQGHVEIPPPASNEASKASTAPDDQPAFTASQVGVEVIRRSNVIPDSAEPSWHWTGAFPLLWAIGFCVLLLRLMAARLMLWSSERRATLIGLSRRPSGGLPVNETDESIVSVFEEACLQLGVRPSVRLLIDSESAIPAVWGVIRLRVVLPAAARWWSREQLRSVLLHEVAHIKRRDTIAQLLAQIACAMHWFNPLVWFASWRLHVERERACDDLVLASGVRASAYAEHLLHVATKLSPALWTSACALAMARKSSLEHRLQAVLSKKLNRRKVPAAIAAIALLLGGCIAIPVSMLRGASEEPQIASESSAVKDEPPAAAAPMTEMKPKHKDAQTLFNQWQNNARTNGKIPGALIGRLGVMVEYFNELNETGELVEKFRAILPRFDAKRDWTVSNAIALLDDVAAIHRIPLLNTLDSAAEETMRTGQPLPMELADAPWGKPAPSGLRVAWLLEPRKKEHRLGASLRSRILVHNSGEQAVVFTMPSWQQSAKHTAHDADGAAIRVTSTFWTTMAQKTTYRLAPGRYLETPAPGIGVGAKTDDEDWANIRPGAWILANEGDEVLFTPAPVEVRCSPRVIGTRMVGGRPTNVDPKNATDLWQRIIAERVQRELPIPAAAAERKQIIARVTRDLFGEAPTPQEIAAFVADDAPTAQASWEKRLLKRPGIAPFTGALPPGEIRFRVLAADPETAKRPRAAARPGYYILGDKQRLHVERTGNKNKATIRFFSADRKKNPPAKPYEIALPDGRLTYGIVWDRSAGVLWVVQKGLARKYEFTNPAKVKETQFKGDAVRIVPQRFRGSLKAVLDVPAAPVQQQQSPP